MRLATFIDMRYLQRCNLDFQIDMQKLAHLMSSLIERHSDQPVTMARTIVVSSIPVNVAQQDLQQIDRLMSFYHKLKHFPFFEVITLPMNHYGYRLRREDRHQSNSLDEREFIPVEKGVTSTITVRMMELLYRDRAIDAACVGFWG